MSNTIGALAKALAAAQAELKPAIKSAENPYFKSSYADLTTCLEAVLPVFSKHGLAICQTTNVTQDGIKAILNTVLMHESGEWIMGSYPIVSKDATNPQAIGSAMTYAKRYALCALTGLGTHDDDGHTATDTQTPDATEGPVKTAIGLLSDAQVNRLYAIGKSVNWDRAKVDEHVKKYGVTEAKYLRYPDYNELVGFIQMHPVITTTKPTGKGTYSERTKIGV